MRAFFWLAVISRGLEITLPKPSSSSADNSRLSRLPPGKLRMVAMEEGELLPMPPAPMLTLRPLPAMSIGRPRAIFDAHPKVPQVTPDALSPSGPWAEAPHLTPRFLAKVSRDSTRRGSINPDRKSTQL